MKKITNVVYNNPIRRSVYQNLKLTLNQQGNWLILPIVLFLTVIMASYLGVWDTLLVKYAVTILVLVSLPCLNVFGRAWLKTNPDEEGVKIEEDKLEIRYPFPKAAQQIALSSVTRISVNLINNQAWVNYNKDQVVSIHAVPEQAWRDLASRHPIPVLFYYKSNNSMAIDPLNQDDHVLQHKQGEIALTDWQAFVQRYPKVTFLGKQESFNEPYQEMPALVLQYDLSTSMVNPVVRTDNG
jgi:hypothetical protein